MFGQEYPSRVRGQRAARRLYSYMQATKRSQCREAARSAWAHTRMRLLAYLAPWLFDDKGRGFPTGNRY